MTTQAPSTNPFAWLRQRRSPLSVRLSVVSDTAIPERALQTDRAHADALVGQQIHAVLTTVFDDVYSATPSDDIHLLRAPTGAGKTTKALSYIAADPRTYEWDGREAEAGHPGPIVFLLPTYANIAELRARADDLGLNPRLSPARLKAQAAELGFVSEDDIEEYVDSVADKRLKTMVYKGKVAAGCKRADEIMAMMLASLPTAGLCQSKILHEGRAAEHRKCRFYDGCDAISQRQQIQQAHVVFLPRNFLDLRIPDEIKKVRAVIADESIFSLLVHSTTFPLKTLLDGRPAPRLTEAEKAAGSTRAGLKAFRDDVAKVVHAGLLAGIDPATALRKHRFDVPDMPEVVPIPGLLARNIDVARRSVGTEVVDRGRINPDMSQQDIFELCRQPVGAHVKAEHRLWSMIEQQVDAGMKAPDVRIQLLGRDTAEPMIRLSWLSEANWADRPMLLLDASGDEDITARVFPGRTVYRHDVIVDFNLRTLACIDQRFSIRSIVPGPDATPEQRFRSAVLVQEIRCVISAICGNHAYGRVLIGMPRKVRKAICYRWLPPSNADFLHSNAEAGLDFARKHVAVVSIGRQELPISEIDAQVAALTHGDQYEELPIDRLGTGLNEDGIGIYPHEIERMLLLRDGRHCVYTTHEHEGDLARRVQHQYREEKIRQLVGRLRPVYRADTPAAYIIGQAVPDDLIIDEIVGWEDLVKSSSSFWNAVRLAGGVIDPILLSKAAPDTAVERDYRTLIEKLPVSVLAGYHRIDAVIAGREQRIYVPGHIAPAEVPSYLCELYESFGIEAGADLMIECELTVAAAEVRPVDTLEQQLGDMAWRQQCEREDLGAMRAVVRKRGEYRAGAGMYRAGFGDLQKRKASLGVWAAMQTLADPWISAGVEPELPAKADERAVA